MFAVVADKIINKYTSYVLISALSTGLFFPPFNNMGVCILGELCVTISLMHNTYEAEDHLLSISWIINVVYLVPPFVGKTGSSCKADPEKICFYLE